MKIRDQLIQLETLALRLESEGKTLDAAFLRGVACELMKQAGSAALLNDMLADVVQIVEIEDFFNEGEQPCLN